MSRCKIYCADNMIVGRWYKLLAYPLDVNEDITTIYNTTFECDNLDVAYIVHDTVYIKKTGSFTITAHDMYGNSDQKTIQAIPEPEVERTTYSIEPDSWDDLKNQIEAKKNAYINVAKGTYDFTVTETPISIPEGTIVDFNGSELNISSSVNAYKGFQFFWDNSGIRNATFNGVNMGSGTDYSEQCALVILTSGKNIKLENLIFNSVAGFNITIGTWPNFWYCKPSYESGRWMEENNFSGYIDDSGEIQASTGRWTMSEMAETIITEDRSFCIGYSGMWLPAIARACDIAFYNENQEFIELDKDLMFYRKYYYPEGAKYFRMSVWQDAEPTNQNARDDICFIRMMGGTNEFTDRFATVEDLWLDNVVCNGHASGGLSVVGVCQDIHINRLKAIGNGWKNAWAFDIEDSWNSSMGVVISHSYFGNGMVIFIGSQGLSMISTTTGYLSIRALAHAVTIINSLCQNIQVQQVRNNLTLINSYGGSITNQEEYENVYTFGDIEQKEASAMRSTIENVLDS